VQGHARERRERNRACQQAPGKLTHGDSPPSLPAAADRRSLGEGGCTPLITLGGSKGPASGSPSAAQFTVALARPSRVDLL
jgi:hypothetical protein